MGNNQFVHDALVLVQSDSRIASAPHFEFDSQLPFIGTVVKKICFFFLYLTGAEIHMKNIVVW